MSSMSNAKKLKEQAQELSILFVEDHDELRVQTQEILKNFFKDVCVAINGKDALKEYTKYYKNNHKHFDIVLSDIEMPLMNGVALAEAIYQINEDQILIIASAHDETKYLLPLINLGIDQFIKKPLDFQELLTALLKATKSINQQTMVESLTHIKFDNNFTYNKENQSLYNGSENIYLTKYEIIFLELLTLNIGKIYSNEEIVTFFHKKTETIDSQNIRKLVSKLRKKLPKNTLESIYAIGYKIN